MKIIITEDQLKKVIYSYINNIIDKMDLKKIELPQARDCIFWVESGNEEVRIEYRKDLKWMTYSNVMIDEIKNIFDLSEEKLESIMLEYSIHHFNLDVEEALPTYVWNSRWADVTKVIRKEDPPYRLSI